LQRRDSGGTSKAKLVRQIHPCPPPADRPHDLNAHAIKR
jgi:hypothetical protein